MTVRAAFSSLWLVYDTSSPEPQAFHPMYEPSSTASTASSSAVNLHTARNAPSPVRWAECLAKTGTSREKRMDADAIALCNPTSPD